MLLAGGQGSRLKALTSDIAKPAVPFGGKYRIIDFPLSNCVNSGIDTVGILTQYQPLLLNQHIGNGSPWGLNRNFGGAHVLPPYAKSERSEWYKGTANAIYQNIHFIDGYDPDFVLILSGDHIYKMNYRDMINEHIKTAADCTIAVINVDLEEASRFGIMNTNADGTIYEFEEKPKKPKSTKASMGIYVFNWQVLKKALIKDEHTENSANDFGKNIIPMMLEEGMKLVAYEFEGYWKDVGTIESLWQANMDLIDKSVSFGLKDGGKIYSRNNAAAPSVISDEANVQNGMVAEGCEINGYVENSIISTGCYIGENAVVKDSVIMPGVEILSGAKVYHSIIGENAGIGQNAVCGTEKKEAGITVVGAGKKVRAGVEFVSKEA